MSKPLIVLGHETDAGLREFPLPDGGRAIELATVPIEFDAPMRERMTCDVTLSIGSRPIIRKHLEAAEAAGITHATLFRITDALGYEYAFLGAFGKRKS